MRSELERLLTDTAEQAFERLAFLMPDLDPDDDPVPAGNGLAGMVVRFRGPSHGALVLRADAPLRQALATNMLGDEGSLADELQLDALGELTNVICGNLLPLVEGPAADFSLDAPVPEETAGALGPVRAAVRVVLDGGTAEVALLERAP